MRNKHKHTRVPPPLKWHGGKKYLAERIVALMPPHLHYVEPYAGGLAVLWAKNPEGVSEVVNDLNGHLINFYRVLQRPKRFERFRRILEVMPFSREEFEHAKEQLASQADADPVDRAVWFFVVNRMSMSGRMQNFTGITKTRTRRGMNGEVSAWLSAVEGLPAVHERLLRVLVENDPALDVIARHDGPKTLFYCDPPYLPETRTSPDAYGELEMTRAEHKEFLRTILKVQGKVMVSGYPSTRYDRLLDGWTRHEFELANHAAAGREKRRMTEVLWCNF